MKRVLILSMLALGALAADARTALAQSDTSPNRMLIFVDFGDIKGSSTDPQHKDWIEAWAIRQSYSAADPARTGCAVEFVKGLDIAGPALWRSAVQGSHFKNVTIEIVTNDSLRVPIYRVEMEEVQVSGITTAGSDAFSDQVTLSVRGRFQLTVNEQAPDGSIRATHTRNYYCTTGRAAQR